MINDHEATLMEFLKVIFGLNSPCMSNMCLPVVKYYILTKVLSRLEQQLIIFLSTFSVISAKLHSSVQETSWK